MKLTRKQIAAACAMIAVAVFAIPVAVKAWPPAPFYGAAAVGSPPLFSAGDTGGPTTTSGQLLVLSEIAKYSTANIPPQNTVVGTTSFASILITVWGVNTGVPGHAQGLTAGLIPNVQLETDDIDYTNYHCTSRSEGDYIGQTNTAGSDLFQHCPVAKTSYHNHAKDYFVKVYTPSGYHTDVISSYGREMTIENDSGGEYIKYRITLHKGEYKSLGFWFINNNNPDYVSFTPLPSDLFQPAEESTLDPNNPGNSDCNVYNSVLCYVNAVRRSVGAAPITQVLPALQEASRKKSNEMITYNYFAHPDHNGVDASQMAKDLGYNGEFGQNLAAGNDSLGTPQGIVNGWVNSKYHCGPDPATYTTDPNDPSYDPAVAGQYDGTDVMDNFGSIDGGFYHGQKCPNQTRYHPEHFENLINPSWTTIGIGFEETEGPFTSIPACATGVKCISVVTADFGQ